MNSFVLYEQYKGQCEKPTSQADIDERDVLLGLVRGAKKSVDIYAGEGKHWNPLAKPFWAIVREKRKDNPDFAVSITLGRLMIAASDGDYGLSEEDTPLNALARGYFDCFGYKRQKNSHIFFNDVSVWDQMKLGYFHSLIVDEESVCVEEPHGCPQADPTTGDGETYEDHEWFVVENNKEFAKKLLQSYDAYKRLAGLREDGSLKKTEKAMRQFTRKEADYYKADEVKKCAFSTKDEYRDIMHKKIGVAYA